jgi:GNAT superfamily N-acetyltransferase
MTVLFAADGYCVRELRRVELPALQELFRANSEYFEAVGGQPPRPDEAQLEFEELPPPHLTFSKRWFAGVFDEPGRLRGVLIVVADLAAQGVWHIALFLLDGQARGTGAAMRLHSALQDWACRSGARWLRLAVISGNVAAERFWAKCGYQQVRTRPYVNASGAAVTARVLVKPLGDGAVEEYLALVPRDAPHSTLP